MEYRARLLEMYSASGAIDHEPREDDKPGVLGIQGAICDTVGETSEWQGYVSETPNRLEFER